MTLVDTPALTLSAPVNLRDLGGIPVAGGVVATGFAIRSDDLATITDEAADALVGAGLRGVIDLRSRNEVHVTGRGPLFDRSVAYHHVPLMTSIGDPLGTTTEVAAVVAAAAPTRTRPEMPSMTELYVSRFETTAPAIVSTLAIMAHSDGATAFHCAAGKDRTGVIAAALLLALGADDDTVIADYRATYRNLPAIMERLSGYMRHVLALSGYDLDALQGQEEDAVRDEQAMAETLATLRERHGDPLAPLRAAGLSAGLVETLRERAVV